MSSGRLKLRSKAKKDLAELFENSANTLVIHYSCESFYDRPEGRSPRITSLAVRNLQSAQTESFSIHKIAERTRVPFNEIESHYDTLEKGMLDEYFDFIRTHQNYRWMHWNMRDQNYGFPAIEHRHQVLGGQPIRIPDERKYDLSRILIDMFGPGYIGHPRLPKLMERNHVVPRDMMTGEQEATAFDQKDYVGLHQSTLRKADVIANIATRCFEGRLKTNAGMKDSYGISPAAVWEGIKDHWILGLLGLIATVTGIVAFFGLGLPGGK